MRMKRVATAALTYFAAVFAVGFLLGTIRLIFLTPILGELVGVAIELPIMLSVSWLMCGLLINLFAIDHDWIDRATMGILAFTMLITAELSLSIFALGSPSLTTLKPSILQRVHWVLQDRLNLRHFL